MQFFALLNAENEAMFAGSKLKRIWRVHWNTQIIVLQIIKLCIRPVKQIF